MSAPLQLRYTPEQNEKKQAAEGEVADLEEAIGLEEDEGKKAGLVTELDKKKLELVELLSGFEVAPPCPRLPPPYPKATSCDSLLQNLDSRKMGST